MALPTTTFRTELTEIERREWDAQNAVISEWMTQEHDADGKHTSITALDETITSPDDFLTLVSSAVPQTPVTVQTVGQETMTDGQGTARRRLVLTGPTGVGLGIEVPTTLAEGSTRQANFGVPFPASGNMPEQQLYNAVSIMGRLQLLGQSSYTPSANDLAALNSDTGASVLGPLYSVYRLTPAADRTIHGIYVVDLLNGARGHQLDLINDSSFVITFGTGTVTNAEKILGTPTRIGPNGAVRLVYDIHNLGWRIVSQYWGPSWQSYTPTWTATGTAPAIGNGSLTGKYAVIGNVVQIRLFLSAGSTTTFGTGVWKFTLPVNLTSSANDAPVLFNAVAFDVSAGAPFQGICWRDSGSQTVIALYTPGSSTQFGPSAPFTWASPDQLHILGAYQMGA